MLTGETLKGWSNSSESKQTNKLKTKMNINQDTSATSKKLENTSFPNNACTGGTLKLSDVKCRATQQTTRRRYNSTFWALVECVSTNDCVRKVGSQAPGRFFKTKCWTLTKVNDPTSSLGGAIGQTTSKNKAKGCKNYFTRDIIILSILISASSLWCYLSSQVCIHGRRKDFSSRGQ